MLYGDARLVEIIIKAKHGLTTAQTHKEQLRSHYANSFGSMLSLVLYRLIKKDPISSGQLDHIEQTLLIANQLKELGLLTIDERSLQMLQLLRFSHWLHLPFSNTALATRTTLLADKFLDCLTSCPIDESMTHEQDRLAFTLFEILIQFLGYDGGYESALSTWFDRYPDVLKSDYALSQANAENCQVALDTCLITGADFKLTSQVWAWASTCKKREFKPSQLLATLFMQGIPFAQNLKYTSHSSATTLKYHKQNTITLYNKLKEANLISDANISFTCVVLAIRHNTDNQVIRELVITYLSTLTTEKKIDALSSIFSDFLYTLLISDEVAYLKEEPLDLILCLMNITMDYSLFDFEQQNQILTSLFNANIMRYCLADDTRYLLLLKIIDYAIEKGHIGWTTQLLTDINNQSDYKPISCKVISTLASLTKTRRETFQKAFSQPCKKKAAITDRIGLEQHIRLNESDFYIWLLCLYAGDFTETGIVTYLDPENEGHVAFVKTLLTYTLTINPHVCGQFLTIFPNWSGKLLSEQLMPLTHKTIALFIKHNPEQACLLLEKNKNAISSHRA